MKSLTLNQRHALERIRSVRDLQVRKIQEVIDSNEHMKGSTPSEWVNEVLLTDTHKVKRPLIKALVRKGYLDIRSTDGWGNEIKVLTKE